MSVGSLLSRRSLGTIATKVSLFFAGETLACLHEFHSFIRVNFSSPGAPWGGIHGIWISVHWPLPSRFPLFDCLRFFVCL